MFRARLPSIFRTCHKMPRLPRNVHLVTTSRSADNAIRKKHATRHVQNAAPATQNDMTTASDTSRKSSFATFPYFSHRHGNVAPTTAADGRLRTPKAGSHEHPRPPNVKREPFATHSGKILAMALLHVAPSKPFILHRIRYCGFRSG